MSVDFPTPPLPEATARTRVDGDSEIVFSARPPRRRDDQRGLLLRAHHVEAEPDRGDTLDRRDGPRHLLLERVPERAPGDGQRDRHGYRSRVLDEDVANHVELGHRLPDLGVDDLLERLQDRVAVRRMRSRVHQRSDRVGASEVPLRAPRRARANPPPRAASECRDRGAPLQEADRRRARPRGRAR